MAATGAPEYSKVSPQDLAYPPALRQKEWELWNRRRGNPYSQPSVGFALSGGGIRSATFCLGVFQALAKEPGLLRKIDYISSVSGGGFFASFYGRLFAREDIDNTTTPSERLTDVEKLLSPDAKTRLEFPDETTTDGKQVRSWKSGVFGWLRENGRYLAPNGNGDLLIALAVFIRNWATIQLFLASSLLALFLILGLIRFALPPVSLADTARFWWSPYIYVAGAMALFGALPFGWSYWCFTLRDPDGVTARQFTSTERWKAAGNFGLRGMIVLTGLGVFLIAAAAVLHSLIEVKPLRYAGVAIVDLTFIAWQYGRLYGSLSDPMRIRSKDGQRPPVPPDSLRRRLIATWIALVPGNEAGHPAGLEKAMKRIWAMLAGLSIIVAAFAAVWQPSSPMPVTVSMLASALVLVVLAVIFWRVTTPDRAEALLDQSEKARNILTQYLSTAIVVTLGIFAFVLIDSTGQTVYAMSFHNTILRMLIAAFTAVLSVVPFAQWIVSLVSTRKNAPPKLSMRVLAALGATIVFLPFLISINAFSHALAYDFRPPADAPKALSSSESSDALALVIGGEPSTLNLNVAMTKDRPPASSSQKNSDATFRSSDLVLTYLVLVVLFCFLVGGGWTGSPWIFINRSSLHPLYAARLIRAYLGASNNLRYGSKAPGISDPVDGDDIAQESYWRPTEKEGFWEKGPPLHLVNVTINETVDGRTHTEQRDRKGIGMAIGPAGFSVGIKHHVVVAPDGKPSTYKIYPEAGRGDYRVFHPDDQQPKDTFAGQELSLGNWTAVSGAAVATGLGSLNSLGTSLLTGFFNLRLGFWWDSGTDSITAGSGVSRTLGKWITRIFPAQSSLIDEFMGRFHGTVRRYWYLTDGGHFEDLGAYELIRRRLPVIVIIDAEADPDYAFSELANLILKARLDFNAEITFLDRENPGDLAAFNKATDKLSDYFHYVRQEFFGTLDQLRRGKWASEPVPERKAFFKSVRETGLSLRHVALARISYLDDPDASSLLLLIKPTLIGEEPQDVLNYHSANPSFPQQTTVEQFYNEAQWESYRRLGQHIAERLFNLP